MGERPTKAGLPAPRRLLVETMERIGFGRIEGLTVRDGQPVFNPPPRIIHEIKIAGENNPRSGLPAADFELKHQVLELFDHLTRLQTGKLESIEVRHGLPSRIILERRVSDPEMV